MTQTPVKEDLIRNAWLGRVSGCLLGKPVETLSFTKGRVGVTDYLKQVEALPLRDYIPADPESSVNVFKDCCRGFITRAEPDDDINYTVLALMMLEGSGLALCTEDVARGWLKYLPGGMTFTAERAAYSLILDKCSPAFAFGEAAGFDLAECADNEFNDWIGAQIRADLYGWVCPGRPVLAARLAREDASLSHRGDGVYGAVFVAAFGAALVGASTMEEALERALQEIPRDSKAAQAVVFASSLQGMADAVDIIHERYKALNPVHTVNNLALVVWALLTHRDDYSAAIGSVVEAGLDTDCNGATVGGLWGLQGKPVPSQWTDPWQGSVAVTLAGVAELHIDALVARTVQVTESIAATHQDVGNTPRDMG
ncbi:MAG: ADP-ribosylglycohydrolase [Halieaceae bacterium]|jgi:ADP-ribosylglycohydrolase